MNEEQLEKEIIKALEIKDRDAWLKVNPTTELKDFIKFGKKMYKEQNGKKK